MHPMKRHLLSVPLIATSLFAQYTGEPPTTLVSAAAYAPLGIASLGNFTSANYQTRLVASSTLPAGTYYACLTVGTTSPAASYRLMSGTFDRLTGTFTKNTDADGLNTSFGTAELFALSVTNDLLTAAFDTAAGVRYATRANTSSPFVLQAAKITGVPAGYLDPNFGYVGGKDVLFFTTQAAIQFGDYANGAVTNIRTVVSGKVSAHSPMPVNDASGTTRALTYCDASVSPYALYFASSLVADAGMPPKAYYNTGGTTWIENGNATGGTVTIISGVNTYTIPLQLGIAGVNSTTYPALTAGITNITSFAPQQKPAAVPYLGITAIGLLAPAGVALGGIVVGNYSQTSFTLLPSGTFNNETGTFEQNLPLPALPAGLKIHMQTLVIDLSANKIYLSNTGKLEWI